MTEAAAAPRAPAVTVFVWYARHDRAWAEGYLLSALSDAGIGVTTEADFALGRPLLGEFERAITSAQWVVLVVSRAFLSNDVAEYIALMAHHYGLDSGTWPVIPVLLEDVRLPVRLSVLTSLDAREVDGWRPAVNRLVASLGQVPVAAAPAPPCPYVGLLAFGPQQADQFFGRETEIDDAIGRLEAGLRCLTVIGPSGSGKSSLVLAGVMPLLQARGWRVDVVRPADIAAAPPDPDGATGPTLLVVDQAEESFALGPDAALMLSSVVRSWTQRPDHAAVMTLRADFYPQIMSSPLWPLVRAQRLELLPMAGDALRRAIERPAQDVGVLVESSLVERLVADAEGEPGCLPLLQETLVLLWARIERRLLPLSAYDALVLPRQRYGEPPRTGLQVALARRADGVLAELDDGQRRVARRIFVRLVHFDDGRMVRRRQRLDELRIAGEHEAAFHAVLERLVASRLVIKDGDDDHAMTVDLAHEALIGGWPRFQAWLQDRRVHEDVRRRLEGKALEWRRLGSRHGGLLDEVELVEAERWLAAQDADDLESSEDLRSLLAASRAEIDRHRAEREQRRIEQARTNRRLRVLSIVLTVFLTSTLGLLVLVNDARSRAERARVVARAGEIAATVTALPDELFDRALLLGIAGHALHADTRSRGALLSAVTTNPRIVRQFHADGPVRATALSPDGLLAFGTRWGDIELRRLESGERTRRLRLPSGELRSLAFAADGRTLVAGGSDGTVATWNVMTGEPAGSPEQRHDGSVRALAFSRDGRWSASGSADRGIVLRDTDGSERRLIAHGDWVNALAFSPDGTTLVSAGGASAGRSVDQRIIAWDTERGVVRWSEDGHDDAVRALAIDADGRTLASAGEDNIVRLWDLETHRARAALEGHTNRIYAVTFLPDGDLLASAGRDHSIRIWDARTGEPVGPALTAHSAGVATLTAAGPRRLVSGADDGRVIVWNLDARPTHRIARDLGGSNVTTVAGSADGRLIATAGEDSVVTLRDAVGTPTGNIRVGGPVRALALDDGGQRLASATSDGRLQVWDTRTGRATSEAKHTGDTRLVLAIGRDGRVATGGRDGAVRVWEPTLRAPPVVLRGHTSWVTDVSFLNASRLASVGADGRLLVHDVDELTPGATSPAELDPPGSQLTAVAVAPDAEVIVTGDTDARVRVWEAAKGATNDPSARTLPGHRGIVTALVATADGRRFASGDVTGTMMLWDADGPELRQLGEPLDLGAPISGLAFGTAGRTLTVGTGDGLQVWDMEPQAWIRAACAVVSRDLSPLERQPFAPDLEDLRLCDGHDLWRSPKR